MKAMILNKLADLRNDNRPLHFEDLPVPERAAHAIPDIFTDKQATPLLCAGAIGYRSLRLAIPSPCPLLGETNTALMELKQQKIRGAKVLAV